MLSNLLKLVMKTNRLACMYNTASTIYYYIEGLMKKDANSYIGENEADAKFKCISKAG